MKHVRDVSRDSGGSENPNNKNKVNLVVTGGTKFRSIEHTDDAEEA